ncbi:MAG: rod shape-determining protein RodA [Desulforudis sp.]|nr:MAG: rod shape-determining protein RodA [Desulforudis sp.]
MSGRRLLRNLDYSLILVAMMIIALGLVTISSASTSTGTGQGVFLTRIVGKQLISVALGTVVLIIIMFLRYEDLSRYRRILYGLNIFLLLAVLVSGHEALGAQRWIQIGGFQFQPSEPAKLIMIITLADFLARREGNLARLRDLLPVFAYVSVPMLLILVQPDLGTTLVFFAITFGMLYVAGARPLLLGGLASGGLGGVLLWIWGHLQHGIWIPLKDYQISRLTIFLNPWADWAGAGYHMIQSQIAIGAGGLWGRGLYSGSQNQLNFLPEQHTDFIFSVLAEELGFVGVLILLTLYFILLYRGLRIASQARDLFGTLMATGIVSMLFFHILTNIGMTAGIMPVTGIPLPLFSYGGTSMLTTLAAVGILLNIWLQRQKIIF